MNSKIAFLTLGLLLGSSQIFAQKSNEKITSKDLLGKWQIKTRIVGSAYLQSFEFDANGIFIYRPSEYDNLNPLKYIQGNYRLQNDSLLLKVTAIAVREGFKVVASDPAWQFGSFRLIGGKVETAHQDNVEAEPHTLVGLERDPKNVITSIKLDGEKYFRIVK